MKLSQKVKPYKKVDGIRQEEPSKWEKFWCELFQFVAKGIAGKWEIIFKIKF